MKALITGASSGIGKSIAIELSKRKYELVLVARDKEKLEQLKKELNTNVEIYALDLADENNCKLLYSNVKDVDVLINNAGFGLLGNFTSTDLDTELNMIKTNDIAVHILTKLYLTDMKAKNSGHILNVASIAGFMPGPLMATYYATKSYVVRLTQSIREELKQEKSDVKISLLCPGPVNTNFNNVAGVKFRLRSLTSDYVAEYAIKRMISNKFLIIPGLDIKFAIRFSKLIPDILLGKIAYRMQKKKIE